MEVQSHFEFQDWQEAFKTWRELSPLYGDKIRFLISTHHYSSGYWIETVPEDIDLDLQDKTIIVYSGSAVDELEKRIIAEIQRSKDKGGSPQFVK